MKPSRQRGLYNIYKPVSETQWESGQSGRQVNHSSSLFVFVVYDQGCILTTDQHQVFYFFFIFMISRWITVYEMIRGRTASRVSQDALERNPRSPHEGRPDQRVVFTLCLVLYCRHGDA